MFCNADFLIVSTTSFFKELGFSCDRFVQILRIDQFVVQSKIMSKQNKERYVYITWTKTIWLTEIVQLINTCNLLSKGILLDIFSLGKFSTSEMKFC